MRPSLYSAPALTAAQDSYFSRMRRAVTDRAASIGIEVVDMQWVFVRHFAVHGQPFEYEIDGHWNALGHRLVAEAISRSNVVTREFPQ